MAKKKRLKTPFKIIIVGLSFVLVMSFYMLINNMTKKSNSQYSQEVIEYKGIIEAETRKNGIGEYCDLLLAIMMQESSGKGNDPMQSSECEYNLQYKRIPNSIDNPQYSIEVGVKYFAKCLTTVKCESLNDAQKIYLALQAYNYGIGYIQYAQSLGGYSYQNAIDFQNKNKVIQKTNVYGDSKYVYHVLRYYQDSSLVDQWLKEYH